MIEKRIWFLLIVIHFCTSILGADDDTNIREHLPLIPIQTPEVPSIVIEQDGFALYDSYVHRHLINGEEREEPRCRRNIRYFLRGVSAIVGATAGIPFVHVACEAGNNIGGTPLCVMVSSGTVISYGAASTWAAFHLTSKFDFQKNRDLARYQKNVKGSLLKPILCNTLSLLSCISDTYSVYKYNSNKFLVFPAFLVDYAFKTEGYYYLFDQISTMYFNRHVGSHVKTLNERLIGIINQNIIPQVLDDVLSSPIEKREYLEKLLKSNNFADLIKNYDLSFDNDSSDIWCGGIPKKIFKRVGLIFPLGNACVNGILAYEALQLLVSSSVFCGIGSVVITLPSFALDVLGTTESLDNIFDIVYNKARGKKQKSYIKDMLPIYYYMIPIVATVLSAFSAMGDAYVANDTVSTSALHALSFFLPWMVLGANTMFESFASCEIAHDFIKFIIKNFGASYKKASLKIIDELEDLKLALAFNFFSLPEQLE